MFFFFYCSPSFTLQALRAWTTDKDVLLADAHRGEVEIKDVLLADAHRGEVEIWWNYGRQGARSPSSIN